MYFQPMRPKLSRRPSRCEAVAGVRGCVRDYILRHMLDAVPGTFKVLICDRPAAAVLNCCMRVHDLMEHGVTLLEDLMTPRQPIISSPALYFFYPNDESVNRVIQDWTSTDPYKEAHIFALGTTSQRHLEQLAQAEVSVKVMSFKDMMLDFVAPEPLVFHLNMRDELPVFLSLRLLPSQEFTLDDAASRLLSVFHVLSSGVPVIHYQNRSLICQRFATAFFEKVARLCSEVPSFRSGTGGCDPPTLIILDRLFDTVTPLVHHRTYQCLLADLMPLENGVYTQTLTNRMGEVLEQEHFLDEEDPYWSLYRHSFFSRCLQEFPDALKKLYTEHPNLARGMGQKLDVAELGNAVRALPEFQEQQAKLSLHIDICTKVMDLYRTQHLAEVCEIEQDIAAHRRSFKANFENVRRLLKDFTIPRAVRLRLLLLFAAASDAKDLTDAKKQQLLQEGNLAADAHRISALGRMASVAARPLQEADVSSGRKRQNDCPTNGASLDGGDPFVNPISLIIEGAANNTLNSIDFPVMSPLRVSRAAAAGHQVHDDGAFRKKTLRVGSSLAAVQHDSAFGPDGTNNGAGAAVSTGTVLPRNRSSEASLFNTGGSDVGAASLAKTQRIILFVMGGVTFSEMRAAYEATKKFGREVIIGGTSILSPDAFIQELGALQ